MKMYEKMGIDPTTEGGMRKLLGIICKDIPDGEYDKCNGGGSCEKCKAKRLTAEVPTKKRWQTIQSDEDVKRLYQEFHNFCNLKSCEGCKNHHIAYESGCFVKNLCEEVEE